MLKDIVFIMLINVKMPTIVCNLTFMSRINCMLSLVEHGNSLITSGPVLLYLPKTRTHALSLIEIYQLTSCIHVCPLCQ